MEEFPSPVCNGTEGFAKIRDLLKSPLLQQAAKLEQRRESYTSEQVDVKEQILITVSRMLIGSDNPSALQKCAQSEVFDNFINGTTDLISFVALEDLLDSEGSKYHPAWSDRSMKQLSFVGTYKQSIRDVSRFGQSSLNPSQNRTKLHFGEAGSGIGEAELSFSAENARRSANVMLVSGIPQENDDFFQVCYLMAEGGRPVTSPDEVTTGLMIEQPLSFSSAFLRSLGVEEEAKLATIAALASQEHHCQKLPQIKPDLLFSADSIAAYIESWTEVICQISLQSIPVDDFHNNSDSLTEGPRYEIDVWTGTVPTLEAVLQHVSQYTLQKALSLCEDVEVVAKHNDAVAAAKGQIKEASSMARTLSSLSHIFSPLYSNDFGQVVTSLPLMCSSMLYLMQLSPHYAKVRNITRLFKRVVVQIITHLKSIIGADKSGDVLWNITSTPEGTERMTLWCEQVHSMAAAFRDSISGACRDYGKDEESFSQVAGRLELFCKRVAKLRELFTYMTRYALLSVRQFSGMEQCVSRFKWLIRKLRFSGIDVLEYTTPAFDKAFIHLRENLVELDASLRVMIKNAFETITDVNKASLLLKTFAPALSPSVVAKKQTIILEQFCSDMLRLHSHFERFKSKPPSHRNSLPLVSAIGWSRLLSKKLTEKSQILSKEDIPEYAYKVHKRAVSAYNSVAQSIVRYESTCIVSSQSYFEHGLDGLRAPPLLKWSDDGLTTHIDYHAVVSLTAARQLHRLGVSLPLDVQNTLELVPFTFKNLSLLQCLANEYTEVLNNMPSYMRAVTAPLIAEVNTALLPGLEGPLSWMSAGISQFIEDVEIAVKTIVETMTHVRVITEDWLGHALSSITTACFVDMSDAPYSLEGFMSSQKKHLRKQPHLVKRCSNTVERGCCTLLEFLPKEVGNSSDKLLNHFYRQLSKEVIGAIVRTLDCLRNAISPRASNADFMAPQGAPLFIITVGIGNNGVEVHPSAKTVQDTITKLAAAIIDVPNNIEAWQGFEENTVKNDVVKSKEVLKKILLLSSSTIDIEMLLLRFVEKYSQYDNLWAKNKFSVVRQFFQRNPTLEQHEEEINHYTTILHELQAMEDFAKKPPFLFDQRELKAVLLDHVKSWLYSYLKPTHVTARTSLEQLKSKLDTWERNLTSNPPTTLPALSRLVDTLRDVRDFSAEFDQTHQPIKEMYAFLSANDFGVLPVERNLVADMKYRWQKMTVHSENAQCYVQKVQRFFRKDLVHDIQRFRVEVTIFCNRFETIKVSLDNLQALDALERLKKNEIILNDMISRCFHYHKGAKLFSIPFKRCALLEGCETEFKDLMAMYALRNTVSEAETSFKQILWSEVNLSFLHTSIQELLKQFRALPSSLSDRKAYSELQDTLGSLRYHIPLLKMLAEPCIQARHWSRLMSICDQQWCIKPSVFRVKDILSVDLANRREAVEELVLCASKEAHIEKSLEEISELWGSRQLTFVPRFKGWGDILCTSDAYAVKDALEESQLILTNLMSSRYINFFKAEAEMWMKQLSTTTEMMTQWMEVQAAWLHIEVVFSGDTITQQMPDEVRRFAIIDQQWCKIINRAKQAQNIVTFCTGNDLSVLPSLLNHLSECQLKLHVFLEEKRERFPRLYFVSESMLLRILASPDASQLPSVFDGVTEAVVSDDPQCIVTGLESEGDHPLMLTKPVTCTGNVEIWLDELRIETQHTLREGIRQAAVELHTLIGSDEIEVSFFLAYRPLQISQVMLQLLFTSEITSLMSTRQAETCRRTEQRLRMRIREVAASLIKASTNIPKDSVKMFQSLLLNALHLTEVAQRLTHRKNAGNMQWEWVRLLRVYWKGDSDVCAIRCVDTELQYGFDYIGYHEKISITPLTERSFVTLFQAMTLQMCGVLTGSASVGKTETIRDMGTTCGRCVSVFNCSQTMDSVCVGRVLRGLVQTGDWGLFDDFTRIPSAVLSTMASQLACIFMAVKKRVNSFIFTDGLPCKAIHLGCFMTMRGNTSSMVPGNLRSLFRVGSMVKPDRFIIIKMKLLVVGFRDVSNLAMKMDQFLTTLENKFVNRAYDFGLSLLRPIFDEVQQPHAMRPSTSPRASFFCSPQTKMLGTLGHETIVNAMYRVISPMLQSSDLEELQSLLKLIFLSEAVPQNTDYTEFLGEVAESLNYRPSPRFIDKTYQLYVTQKTRHSIMVMGDSSVGKSSITKVLLEALTEEHGLKHKALKIYPRAITCDEMYGYLDSATGRWQMGIFASLWNKANNEARRSQSTWVICDGPVEQGWTDNLSTALDNTKTLSLSNGDRISMASTTRLVFESEHMQNVTPHTASRLGIVFVSKEEVLWEDIVEVHVRNVESMGEFEGLASEHCDTIRRHFLTHAIPMYNACRYEVERKLGEFDPRSALLQCVQATCQTVQQLRRVTDISECCERVCWSVLSTCLGSFCSQNGRVYLDSYIRKKASPGSAPPTGSLAYHYIISNVTGEWVPLNPTILPCDNMCGAFMPTLQTEHIVMYAQACLRLQLPILICGTRHCGKTTLMQAILKGMEEGDTHCKRVKLWQSTTATKLRGVIESYFMKKMGNTYGPRPSGSLFLFFDDVSLPQTAASDASELVRQIVEANGYWDGWRAGEWRSLADLTPLAALDYTLPGKIPRRLLRHFVLLECEAPSPDDVYYIVDKVLPTIQTRIKNMTVDLYFKCAKLFPPNPQQPHHVWSLCRMWRVFAGIKMAPAAAKNNTDQMLALWKHEVTREFCDVLQKECDKQHFRHLTSSLLAKDVVSEDGHAVYYYVKQESVIKEMAGHRNPMSARTRNTTRKISQVFFRKMQSRPSTGLRDLLNGLQIKNYAFKSDTLLYDHVAHAELTKSLRKAKGLLKEGKGELSDIVLVDDMVVHVARVARVLSKKSGSMLLVSQSGFGRRSLVRLASYICAQPFHDITYPKGTQMESMEGLKTAIKASGITGPQCVFIKADDLTSREVVLEKLKHLADMNDVSLIFNQEVGTINQVLLSPAGPPCTQFDANDLAQSMSVANTSFPPQDRQPVLSHTFEKRVKENLHFVICISPSMLTNRVFIRDFSSFFVRFTVNCYEPWSRKSTAVVAEGILKSSSILEVQDELFAKKISGLCGDFHLMARELAKQYEMEHSRVTYDTRDMQKFIQLFTTLLQKRKQEICLYTAKAKVTIKRLQETNDDVSKLQLLSEAKEAMLKQSQQRQALLRAESYETTQEVQNKRRKLDAAKVELAAKSSYTAQARLRAQVNLDLINPRFDQAKQALESITPLDLKNIRSVSTTPFSVRRMFDPLAILLHMPLAEVKVEEVKPRSYVLNDSWAQSGKNLSRQDFVQIITDFTATKKDSINEETMELLSACVGEEEDCSFEKTRRTSGTIGAVLTWASVMMEYYELRRTAEYLLVEVTQAEAKGRASNQKLEKVQEAYEAVSLEARRITRQLEEQKCLQVQLDEEAAKIRLSSEAAVSLVEGLKPLREKWLVSATYFEDMLAELPFYVLIHTFLAVYAGPLNEKYRAVLTERARQLCGEQAPKCHLESFYGKETEPVQQDPLLSSIMCPALNNFASVDNFYKSSLAVVFAMLPYRCSFLIDPERRGLDIIKEYGESKNMNCFSANQTYFMENLLDSMRLGVPVVLENCSGDIHLQMWEILRRNFSRSGRSLVVSVGGKLCEVAEGFELILCCKESDVVLHPQLVKLVNVVDFRASSVGLRDRFFNKVTEEVKVDTQFEVSAIRHALSLSDMKIAELETHMLDSLAVSSVAIVDDDELLTHLFEVKHSIQNETDNAKKWRTALTKAEATLNEYLPVAVRAVSLFNLTTLLQRVSPVYHISMHQFIRIVTRALRDVEANPPEMQQRKLHAMISKLTQVVHVHFSRMILEEHKVFFCLFFALAIARESGMVPEAGIKAFTDLGNSQRTIVANTTKEEEDKEYLDLVEEARAKEDTIFGMAYLQAHSAADEQEQVYGDVFTAAAAHETQDEIHRLQSVTHTVDGGHHPIGRASLAYGRLGFSANTSSFRSSDASHFLGSEDDEDNTLMRDFTATASFAADPLMTGDDDEGETLMLDFATPTMDTTPDFLTHETAPAMQAPPQLTLEPCVEPTLLITEETGQEVKSPQSPLEETAFEPVPPRHPRGDDKKDKKARQPSPGNESAVTFATSPLTKGMKKIASMKSLRAAPGRASKNPAREMPRKKKGDGVVKKSSGEAALGIVVDDALKEHESEAAADDDESDEACADEQNSDEAAAASPLDMTSSHAQRLETCFPVSQSQEPENEGRLSTFGLGCRRYTRECDNDFATKSDNQELFSDDVILAAMRAHDCFAGITPETDASEAKSSSPKHAIVLTATRAPDDERNDDEEVERPRHVGIEVPEPDLCPPKTCTINVSAYDEQMNNILEADLAVLGCEAVAGDGEEEEAFDAQQCTLPNWVPLPSRMNAKFLSDRYEHFRHISKMIDEQKEGFRQWLEHEHPENIMLPVDFPETSSRLFDTFLMIRCFRQDRIVQASKQFVAAFIGEEYSEPADKSYVDAVNSSNVAEPLLCLISHGVDPSGELDLLSKKLKQRLCVVTVGEDEEKRRDEQEDVPEAQPAAAKARALSLSSRSRASTRITICAQDPSSKEEFETTTQEMDEIPAWSLIEREMLSGAWVLLQNIHFSVPILEKVKQHIENEQAKEEMEMARKLEEALKELRDDVTNAVSPTIRDLALLPNSKTRTTKLQEEPKPGFHNQAKMLLTADLNMIDELPLFLVENCSKISRNRPPGLRRSMRTVMDTLSADLVSAFVRPEYKTLVYSMCLIHSILRNRGRYSPNGWGLDHVFQVSDVPAMAGFLHHHFSMLGDVGSRCKPVDFECIESMAGIFFAGEVADETDRSAVLSQITLYLKQLAEVPLTSSEPIEMAPGCVLHWDMSAADVATQISSIPVQDTPAVFGIQNSVDLLAAPETLLESVMKLQDSCPQKNKKHDIDYKQANRAIELLLSKMNGLCPLSDSRRRETSPPLLRAPVQAGPLERYLKSEICALDATVRDVRQSLKNVLCGLYGFRNLYENEYAVIECVLRGEVPHHWDHATKLDYNLPRWSVYLQQRHEQLSNWEESGMPSSLWLGGMKYPKGLLPAFLEHVAEIVVKPLSDIGMTVTVSKHNFDSEFESSPRELYLRNVVLDGAKWDSETNGLTTQVSQLQQTFPPLLCVGVEDVVAPETVILKQEKKRKTSGDDFLQMYKEKVEPVENVLGIPCFSCRSRGDANNILDVLVKDDNKHFWAAKGVAFFAD